MVKVSAPVLTAATVRGAFLHPAMDARALNLGQALLVANPSPEADSIVELLDVLRADDTGEARGVYTLRRLVCDLNDANAREGQCERRIAGSADTLARDLRHLELNDRPALGPSSVAAKSIARTLRAPLRTLDELGGGVTPDAIGLVRAVRAVDAVISRLPSEQVLSATVRYELGEAKFRVLEGIVRERSTNGAGALATAGPEDHGSRRDPFTE